MSEQFPPSADTPRGAALIRLALAWRDAVAAERRLRARDVQRPGQLSLSQLQVLRPLEEVESLPAGRLAAEGELTAGSVSQMLDQLEERGLVRRLRSERDRRVVMVSLTDLGRAKLEAKRRVFWQGWLDAMDGLDEVQLLSAATTLERLRGLIDDFSERHGDGAAEAGSAQQAAPPQVADDRS